MSTEDVPGYKPENRDTLAMGAWAEHEDGSLILVESTEGGRVIYSIFDMVKPVIEFRDAMAEGAFKRKFSWRSGDALTADRWTWHDKTPFPWDRIISAGARAGSRHADVEDQLTEAERVRRARRSINPYDDEMPTYESPDTAAQRARRARELSAGREVDPEEILARIDRTMGKASAAIVEGVQKAIARLAPAKRRPR